MTTLLYIQNTSKSAGCDWLVRLKKTDEAIALLNLYDLNRENFNDKHRKCTIGFTTKKEYRRAGYTFEAVQHFINYIFDNFDMIRILGYTKIENIASQNFMLKLNFKENSKAYSYQDTYKYYELWKEDIN